MGLLKPETQPTTSSANEFKADPAIVKKLVGIVYGESFGAIKQALVKSSSESITTILPAVVNMAFKKIEADGSKIDFETALRAVMQVMLMLTQDAVKSVIKRPLSEDDFHTMLRNTLTMYLKGHKEIVPPEVMAQLTQLGTVMNQHRGQKPTAAPAATEGGMLSPLMQQGQGTPPAEGTPAEEGSPQEKAEGESATAEQTEQANPTTENQEEMA